MSDSALVLFSGGQDSSVCLAWALERYARVETVGFDYGQRHVVEMEARVAVRLHRDLGVNPAGAALALQLMEELDTLRARLQVFDTRR